MTRNRLAVLNDAQSWIDVLRTRARQQPDRRAYTWRHGNRDGETHLTYGELDRRARAIASRLQLSRQPGERALLLYPPGLEFIEALFGALYAGLIAVPAQAGVRSPGDGTPSRVEAIIADAQPDVVLCSRAAADAPDDLDGPPAQRLVTDEVPARCAERWVPPSINRDSLALLQYTSGSTAAPKGVMLTHGNLLHNSSMIHRAFGHSPASRGVIWLPPFHDMGLIGGVLQPLYGGFPVILTSPSSFVLNPLSWLQLISDTRATTSGGPNFAYDLCVRKIPAERRRQLDLSCWQVAFNGADVVRPDTLDEFADAFAEAGFCREAFVPCYGLAEATLMVTSAASSAPPAVQRLRAGALREGRVVPAKFGKPETNVVSVTGCGRVSCGAEVVIVDPDTHRRCRPQDVGEVWVAGPSIARGYWQRPAATAESFAARIAGSGDGPFLRTGDLGFVREGELYITGRLKELIIVAGRNHHPEDIEWTASNSHAGLQSGGCAAFTVAIERIERLVVAAELERGCYRELRRNERRREVADEASGSVQLAVEKSTLAAEASDIKQSIRRAVAERHGLSVHRIALVKPSALPRTTSGKIRRKACRSAFLAERLNLVEELSVCTTN